MTHDEQVKHAKERLIDAVRAWAHTRFPPSLKMETKVRLALSALEMIEEVAEPERYRCYHCGTLSRGAEHSSYTVIRRSIIDDERAIADHISIRETSFVDLADAVAARHNMRSTIPLNGDEWVVAAVERWWRPGARGLRAREIDTV